MIAVGFDEASDQITISNAGTTFAPCSIDLTRAGSRFSLRVRGQAADLIGADFSAFTDANGTGFTDADACGAYLAGILVRAPTRVPPAGGVAAEALAAGMPLAIGRTDGRLRIARADTYPLAFLAGLAEAAAAAGEVGRALRTAVTLPDWTAITGTASLALGQPYFLAAAGGLTLTPDRTAGAGLCLVRVGQALAPDTLAFAPSDPILL